MGIRYNEDTYVSRKDPYSYNSPTNNEGEVIDTNFTSQEQNDLYSLSIVSTNILNTDLTTTATEDGVITSLQSFAYIDTAGKNKTYDIYINSKLIFTFYLLGVGTFENSKTLPNIKIESGDVLKVVRTGDSVGFTTSQKFILIGYSI